MRANARYSSVSLFFDGSYAKKPSQVIHVTRRVKIKAKIVSLFPSKVVRFLVLQIMKMFLKNFRLKNGAA